MRKNADDHKANELRASFLAEITRKHAFKPGIAPSSDIALTETFEVKASVDHGALSFLNKDVFAYLTTVHLDYVVRQKDSNQTVEIFTFAESESVAANIALVLGTCDVTYNIGYFNEAGKKMMIQSERAVHHDTSTSAVTTH